AVGSGKRRHHGVADRLDDRACLGGHDLVKHTKMLANEIIGDKVSDSVVELGRTFEIGEQERQAGQFQALIDVKRIGAVNVAEYLVGQQALGSEKRFSLAEHMMKRFTSDPNRWQDTQIGLIFEHKEQWPSTHFGCYGRPLHLVEDQRQILTFLRRLTFDIDEMRHVGDRLENDQEFGRHLKRHLRLLARRQLY